MELLAGVDVTTQAVERTAESTGADIAGRERTAIGQAMQLHLPIMVGETIPILYVQMDGTGIPVVKKEPRVERVKWTGGRLIPAK